MLINELSKASGVSAHTIRFYEKSGLIKGKRKADVKSNNYFHYDDETVEKLQLIRDAKAVGFTIGEIGQLMDAWYNERMTVKQKLRVLDEKLEAIEKRMAELKAMKKLLGRFRKEVEEGSC